MNFACNLGEGYLSTVDLESFWIWIDRHKYESKSLGEESDCVWTIAA